MTPINRKRHTIDATGTPVGRMATQIATLLQGKHKPTYEPHVDDGDFVEVLNSDKMKIHEKRSEEKMYYRHSGYPGGLKSRSMARQLELDPTKVVEEAVAKMLPKNKLRAPRMKRLTFTK